MIKTILLSLISFATINALGNSKITTFADASKITQQRLIQYLIKGTYISKGNNPLTALDDDEIETSTITCSTNGETYDVFTVYSGDTMHGALFKKNSLEQAGEHGDGDYQIYVNQSYIACHESL